MQVLCYINKLNNGGAERVMSVVANALYDRGHGVTVVNDYRYDNEYKLREGIRHEYIDGLFTNKDNNVVRRTVRRVLYLRKIILESKIDIIISFIFDANFRAILSTYGLKTKNVISVRINPATAYKSKYSKMMANLIYSLADGCVFQTIGARDFYSNSVKKHSKIILNPISDVFFNTISNPMIKKTIVSCGRLTKQKRFDVLIDAFALFHKNNLDFSLEIYGEGELHSVLQKQIDNLRLSSCAFLKGRTEKVNEAIKNTYAYVMSSDFEGLPNSLMEAMVLGLPCIATDCDGGGAKTIIDHGQDGFIVPKGDSEQIAKMIEKIVHDQNIAKTLSENARQKAQIFKSGLIIDEWEKYLKDIVGKS